MLGYSRDGFHFYRPTFKPFLSVKESGSAWNWGNVQSVNGSPLIVNDSLYFYVSGRRLNTDFWDSYTSTGLAKLRRDGFVSLRSKGKEGFVTTEKLTFDGMYMFVNANVVRGVLQVELLDEEGLPIKGFSRKECVAIRKTDATKISVTWKNQQDFSPLLGRNVSIKFYLRDGDLYSFWVSPWVTGESRGYISGGGPNFHASGVDLKSVD